MRPKGEKVYQIYSISASWEETLQPDKDYSNWQLTESGRVKNSTQIYMMFKEEVTDDQARIKAIGWWNKMAMKERRPFDPRPLVERKLSNVKIKVEFIERESWCLSWFSHFTYNIHLTDEELLSSFNEFVWRKRDDQRILDLPLNHPIRKKAQAERHIHCLMGAEDRWRWKGPCHCEGCLKNGITRIDH